MGELANMLPVERMAGPNQNKNYGDLQPVARSMKPILWVLCENLSFGFPPLYQGLQKKKPNWRVIQATRSSLAMNGYCPISGMSFTVHVNLINQ